MIPTDPEEYAKLVFAQPNYMDRKARDLAEKQAAEASLPEGA